MVERWSIGASSTPKLLCLVNAKAVLSIPSPKFERVEGLTLFAKWKNHKKWSATTKIQEPMKLHEVNEMLGQVTLKFCKYTKWHPTENRTSFIGKASLYHRARCKTMIAWNKSGRRRKVIATAKRTTRRTHISQSYSNSFGYLGVLFDEFGEP